jgi:addiction module RelE/StbE family toxin
MKLKWTPQAERDRLNILEYIADDNPLAAIETDELFEQAAEQLLQFPLQGRVGLIPKTREFIPHANYRLVYEIEEDTVWIITIVHVARLWPEIED